MIRNLKKQGDEEKQLLLLKEQLRLAIKNDELISATRRDAQQNIPLELSQEDRRTLAEQLADDVTQREIAQKHLSEFFRSQEVLTILALCSKDQIIAINTLWNGMKDELKKVNTKSMTPKDFITFLNKYTDTAVSLQGALTVGINETSELKELIPSQEDLEKVFDFVKDRSTNPRIPILILSEIGNYVPSEANYEGINELNAMLKQETINTILGALFPNKTALLRAVDEGSISKVERILQGITPDRLTMMKGLKKTLDSLPRRPVAPRPAPARPAPARRNDVIKGLEDYMTKKNKDYLSTQLPSVRAAILSFKAGGPLPIAFEGDFEAFLLNNSKETLDYINGQSPADKSILMNLIKTNTPFDVGTYKIIGNGMKRGRGRPPSNKPKTPYKLKIGEGIKVKREPVNVDFGRYILNTNQLKKQILHVKNRQGGALSWFQPVAISDSFTELMNDMLKTQSVNKHLLKTLDKDEQKLFYEVMDRSGILGGMGLEKPKNTDDEDLKQKFEILLGEYHAGNNSPLLIQQLRKHIIYFTQKGRIPKQKSLAMLMELS